MKNNITKKITTVLTATLLSIVSVTAMACPKGTTLTGGIGANHKGGSCVPINGKKQAAHLKQAEQKTITTATAKKQTSTNTTTSAQTKVNSIVPTEKNDKVTKTK